MSETIDVDRDAVETLYREVVAQTENIEEEWRNPEVDAALDIIGEALYE
ncbi:hypothetical protein [Halobaculum marinum]|uniref:Uncharacterized protein n=1 Tax=Halobaculum marinum TaxID=3031996 RepID=A0ABD5WQ79_9EURY|nr:hypothetical protein [Halobaculum sp. DT55]